MTRERDKALKDLASVELKDSGREGKSTGGGTAQRAESEDEDDEDLQEQVEMLEQVSTLTASMRLCRVKGEDSEGKQCSCTLDDLHF